MKKQELNKLREKPIKKLQKEISQLVLKIRRLQAELAVGKHKNVRLVKNLRRDLAQAKTILREKEVKLQNEKV
jgi:large subunit ribosomal protein L29